MKKNILLALTAFLITNTTYNMDLNGRKPRSRRVQEKICSAFGFPIKNSQPRAKYKLIFPSSSESLDISTESNEKNVDEILDNMLVRLDQQQ